jgi:tRNA-binding protein
MHLLLSYLVSLFFCSIFYADLVISFKIQQMPISWEDFEKIDIRTGTIIEVNDFPKARKPAYQLTIDFGAEFGIKKSSAQITAHYKKEDLLNRQIIAVVNFPPKQIATFISECLVLGVYDENKDVILLQPGRTVNNGHKIG